MGVQAEPPDTGPPHDGSPASTNANMRGDEDAPRGGSRPSLPEVVGLVSSSDDF
ncbi:hypothetical protein PC128_g22913 [Phytophthora cactorum]|nr:hypothetical protein PC120_g21070 [Phytophthora cactorum]KAG3046763.1 hypothetical protein PC121_g20475 [Phytophthora cactorum]KAG3151856.1 hypothetical protein PC128_g22913 [Phytophthora cactorum]KAG4042751.1 hypothetical protein PC123_g21763 [Phytophthora cactorum]